MSNSARVGVRTRHVINFDETEFVPVGVLFGGAKGRERLEAALDDLPAMLEQTDLAKARPWLAWHTVTPKRQYKLVLDSELLHPVLQSAGCQRVEVDLQIKDGSVRVARRARWESEQMPNTAAVTDAFARTCIRAVNTLGAFVHARQLAESVIVDKIKEQLAPRVQERLTTRQTIHQARPSVRVPETNNLAFQVRCDAPNRRF